MYLLQVMFSVTGLQFSYTQAPESMRSVLQGCWQLTVAVGNLIVTIIVGASFFSRQTFEFALFAGLMFVDMAVFMWLAIRYKPIPLETLNDVDNEPGEKKNPLDFPGSSRDAPEEQTNL
jgi:solute carrier family 15 (oligopeptide transporter), member 1